VAVNVFSREMLIYSPRGPRNELAKR